MTTRTKNRRNRFELGRDATNFILAGAVVSMLTIITLIFCAPYVYLFMTSFKSDEQLAQPRDPLLPSNTALFTYQGQNLPLYRVPSGVGGETITLALLQERRTSATFIDPLNLSAAPLEWQGRVRALEQVYDIVWHVENYSKASTQIDYGRLLLNTLFVAVVGAFGSMISAALIAYGFTHFRIPHGEVLFFLVMCTIILPPQVTIIPTFIVFNRLGWTGTFLPLLLPTFFGSAYNIFLLRQYFLTMPAQLDEAAKVDGASPWQVFTRIILPNARPALLTVFILHFLFAWNDFYAPLLYLSGHEENFVIGVGLLKFIQQYSGQPNLLMAATMLTVIVPLSLFFLGQRIFMQGIVITGVEK